MSMIITITPPPPPFPPDGRSGRSKAGRRAGAWVLPVGGEVATVAAIEDALPVCVALAWRQHANAGLLREASSLALATAAPARPHTPPKAHHP